MYIRQQAFQFSPLFLQESGTRSIGLSGLEAPGPSDLSTPTRSERQYEELSSSTETPKGRRRLDTPTRHAIGCLQPAASTLVAVRMQLTYYWYYVVTPF